MEMNRRRSRGVMLAKLMPFCRAVKSPTQDLYNNVHYTSYAPQTDSNNYLSHATTPLPPKVSFLLQPSSLGGESKDMEKKVMRMGRAAEINGVEECVDARAASYISSVRERFKLEHCERRTTVITLDS